MKPCCTTTPDGTPLDSLKWPKSTRLAASLVNFDNQPHGYYLIVDLKHRCVVPLLARAPLTSNPHAAAPG